MTGLRYSAVIGVVLLAANASPSMATTGQEGQASAPASKPPTVLFMCPHGAAKSVLASAYFQHLAKERGLNVRVDSAGKTVVALTGANERAVRNWFEAKNGPNGEFSIALCRHSDQVLETFLLLAGRRDHLRAHSIVRAKDTLQKILGLLSEREAEDR